VTSTPDAISRKWKSLLKKLRATHAAPEQAAAHPPAPLTVVSTAVHATLLWEASSAQARLASQHLGQHFADYNDMRVAIPDQIIHALGERYPLAVERTLRLKSWLADLYRRTNGLDLEPLRDLSKAEARRQLLSLHGMPEFVAACTVMSSLGGHAVPVDARLLALLRNEKIVDADATVADAMTRLEELVEPDELAEVCGVLRTWSDHEGTPPRREEAPAFRPMSLSMLEDGAAAASLATPPSGKPKSKASGKAGSKPATPRKPRPKSQ
jgi:endonuclease III